ncbi:MAG: hypothetical protein EBU90_27505 [Proteobacteria bacterium]|nr:hypothetical protein [Pseudomonadota bacterium]
MIDHEVQFKQILETQRTLSTEIQELNNTLSIKKEQFLKLQGIVEYLTANGIKPEENKKVEFPEGDPK